MKLIVGEEHVVVRGMRPEENWWGKYQFPLPYNLGDRLVVRVNVGDDDWYNQGENQCWFESRDEGITWTRMCAKSAPDCGLLLPNGDKYYIIPGTGQKMDGYKFETTYYLTPDYDFKKRAPEGVIPIQDGMTFFYNGTTIRAYLSSRLPESLDKSEWQVKRIPAGETNAVDETAKVAWEGLTRVIRFKDARSYEGGVMKPISPSGTPRLGPDGAIWVTAFSGEGHVDPATGQYSPYYSAELFRSEDNGKTFEQRGHIEYPADGKDFPYKAGGFSDSDIAFMPDGSIVWFMRSAWACATCQNWDPMYMVRSTDMGKTWSKPEPFAETGVLPRLVTLPCGVTVLCYARPGMYVALTKDGYEWEKFTLIEPKDRSHLANEPIEEPFWHQWDGACGNAGLIPIDENSAMIFYGDFYYPDEDGVKRKTILCRKLTVIK